MPNNVEENSGRSDSRAENLINAMVADGVGNGLTTEQGLLEQIVILYKSGKIGAAEMRKAENTYSQIASEASSEPHGQGAQRQEEQSDVVSKVAGLQVSGKKRGRDVEVEVLSRDVVENDAKTVEPPVKIGKAVSVERG